MLFAGFIMIVSAAGAVDRPAVLRIEGRIATVNRVVAMRLERLLPQVMRQNGFDMWLIICNEDNLDPVFLTMIPYDTWAPITQILVFYDPGPGKEIERLNLSRTNLKGLYKDVWDYNAWDNEKRESQWDCLARIVRELNPRTIGINEGEVQWAAGGLTVPLKKALVEAIGAQYSGRFKSAEPLATRWLETFLDEELDIYGQVVAVAHDILARTMSNVAITPGVTTIDDMNHFYWQQVADLGLDIAFNPSCTVRGRSPQETEKYGKADRTIRRGDLLHCDVGIKYLRYYSDHQEWAYVLRLGESDVPETFKKAMAEANRLQDVYAGQFKAGLTGDQLLANILSTARSGGIATPRVYSHSIGYYLHEPGPLIGLPWEQVRNPGRGEVALVDNSCFTAELSVSVPIPEWGGRELRMALEQDVAFTGGKVHFVNGRQTAFHLVK
jgi:hypothetical protein